MRDRVSCLSRTTPITTPGTSPGNRIAPARSARLSYDSGVDDALVAVSGEVRRLTGELFEQLSGDETTNIVCSGLGLWCSLGVLAAAGDGETATELSNALGVAPEHAAALIARVDERLRVLGGATHALAVWSRLPVDAAFRASLPMVGFGHLDGDTDLDVWISEHTHGMIDRFPVTVTHSTLVALADAIALWSQWDTSFVKHQTKAEQFQRDAESFEVPMMYRRDRAAAVTALGGTTRFDLSCRVPMGGEGSEPRQTHVAPVMRFGLGEAGITPAEVLAAVLSDATGERPSEDFVDVHLPRFGISNNHDLVSPLAAMGVRRAFGADAELGRLYPEPLTGVEARQAALVSVDEVGVRAAAVTAVAMVTAAAPVENPRIMDLRFDRPFAFALIDPELDLPLFAGWVADPRG